MTFEEHVTAALDSLPANLAAALDNVAVVIEEENRRSPTSTASSTGPSTCRPRSRSTADRSWRTSTDPAELEEQIRVTVLHELAHYFGMDEDRIADLGYD